MRAGPRRSAATWRFATTAARHASPIIPAAIGTVRSVRGEPEPRGSPRVKPTCFRFPISTSSSHFPHDRRDRFPEQGRGLCHPVQDCGRGDDDARRRSSRLGGAIGGVAVLHTWGQALMHHPHVHCVVPGGGLSPDGARWIACRADSSWRSNLVPTVSHTFSQTTAAAFNSGALRFFGDLGALAKPAAFAAHLDAMRRIELPSRWGCCHPHPSQTRTCGFPASGSSRESFARGGVAMDDPGWGSGWRFRIALRRAPSDTLWRSRRDNHFCHIRTT